jgi:hypothetical protein
MKTLKYISAFLILLLILPMSSCKKYFEDINISDNLPEDVSVNALLSSAEGHISYGLGGDAARYTGIFVQYITGASRQFATYQRYSFHEDDFDNLWRLNLYGGPMQDLQILIKKAAAGGNVHYQGMAEILQAYALGMVTDYWGAAPFSQAFQGENNFQPVFDSESQIYSTIQSLLDNGIAHLNANDNSVIQPSTDDLIFPPMDPNLDPVEDWATNSLPKWIKFAYGVKARYYIHLSKSDASNAQKALDAISTGGLASNDDDVLFNYGSTETTANPWYQYIQQRDDIIYDDSYEPTYVTPYIYSSMVAKSDPRLTLYIDGGYPGSMFSGISAPVPFFTYAEQKFIESEANFRLGNTVAAATALNDGVIASMNRSEASDSTANIYIATNVTGATNLEETIMYEKYIALYLQPEAWSDWRRTGYPQLTPNVTGREIPRRFIYATSERLYNPNTPQSSTLYSPPLFWDN